MPFSGHQDLFIYNYYSPFDEGLRANLHISFHSSISYVVCQGLEVLKFCSLDCTVIIAYSLYICQVKTGINFVFNFCFQKLKLIFKSRRCQCSYIHCCRQLCKLYYPVVGLIQSSIHLLALWYHAYHIGLVVCGGFEPNLSIAYKAIAYTI